MLARRFLPAPRTVLVCIWVIALFALTLTLVGAAVDRDKLVLAAAPNALVPILGLHFLREYEARAGWVLFTAWLGATYAFIGTISELAVFAAIILIGLLGYFRSAKFYMLAWFGHIAWDLLPRNLPPNLQSLPLACLIFDGIIGAYLAWMAYTRWDQD